MTTYTSGELARGAGVNIETIRYYERRGLLSPAGRGNSGYRVFTDRDVARLNFIRRAKSLGYTLNEIGGLLELADAPETRCATFKQLAAHKIAEVEQKISELTAVKRALETLINTVCPQSAHPATCSRSPASMRLGTVDQ